MAKKKKGNPSTTNQQLLFTDVLYAPRFLESHVGKQILHDPRTAIVELIANAWDAGATTVKITWPNGNGNQRFAIEDNGIGMTDDEFRRRWRTLNYNRMEEQGVRVIFPTNAKDKHPERLAFGRNGIGRWSGFCFGDKYIVETCKDDHYSCYEVARGFDRPFEIKKIKDVTSRKYGTRIACPICRQLSLSPEDVRGEIGMRFLTDPNFQVYVNSDAVSFKDIDDPNIQKLPLAIDDSTKVELIIIDTKGTDRTTKQHGVAWHVGGRLVGSCSWKGTSADELIDGRRIAAKRFTFIVRANHLAEAGAIKQDWSGFDKDNEHFQRAAQVVHEEVRRHLLSVSEEDRMDTLEKAREENRKTLKTLGPLGREKWTKFVTKSQESCPSIKVTDIVKLSEVVANLEQTKSGYALVHKLSEFGPDELDNLDRLLENWTLDMAKVVLDEIGSRLKLVEELHVRTLDKNTREVQDLQPLFEQGLWIFGPEFETIEYTSNQGMMRVVQDLLKCGDITCSRNRPDFVVLPDGTSSLYSYPRYDDTGGVVGTDRLFVIELKKPSVKIGEEQKAQCWKYVKELKSKGHIEEKTRVNCFVLGSHVDPLEASARVEMDGRVIIQPMLFTTVLKRAESRLFKLSERVKNAPFLEKRRDELDAFLAKEEKQSDLF